MPPPADRDALKAAAAGRALELVRPGMVVGLGTGSTAAHFVRGLGRMVAAGLVVRAIPTSNQVAELAREYGIPLLGRLEGPIDLDIDGADEIDPDLNLLKGGGGALAREKLVAEAARRLVVVADSSKLVERLARATRLPVEVLPFLWRRTAGRIEDLGGTASLRGGEDRPFLTDNGNWILDVSVPGGIGDPGGFGSALKALTGVVDHGLFTGLARACLVAGEAGVTVLGRLDS